MINPDFTFIHVTGGDTWNRRPMPPDTMWRIAYGERSEVVCRGLEERGWHRSWGVSEVEFYAPWLVGC